MKTRKILISILLAVILVFACGTVKAVKDSVLKGDPTFNMNLENDRVIINMEQKYNNEIVKNNDIRGKASFSIKLDRSWAWDPVADIECTAKDGHFCAKHNVRNDYEDKYVELNLNSTLYYYRDHAPISDSSVHKKVGLYIMNPSIIVDFSSKDEIFKTTSRNELSYLKVEIFKSAESDPNTEKPIKTMEVQPKKLLIDGKEPEGEFGEQKQTNTKDLKEGTVNKLFINKAYYEKYLKKYIEEGYKIKITAKDKWGFTTTKTFVYGRPILDQKKIEYVSGSGDASGQLKFTVGEYKYKLSGKEQTNKIERVTIYKADKSGNKIGDGLNLSTKLKKKEGKRDGTYEYDGTDDKVGKVEKKQYYNIYVTDENGIVRKCTYQAKNVSSGGGGGGGYYGGETVDNTTAPTVSTVEFIKNDGTPLQVNQEGEKYFNEMINEEVTVNITYDKEVKISDNNINSGWTTAEGNKITKKFTKGETETVSVTATEGTSSCNTTIEVKIDKDPPVIKINGEEVEAKIAKDGEREEVEADETVTEIDKYTEEVTIEVEDDQIEEKDIPDHVKLFKDEIEYDFKNKMKITELGTYTIEATDEMGNKAIYTFILTVNKEDIKINSKNIRITSDGKAIVTNESNITRGMFQNELKLNINSDISIKGKGKNAVELGNGDNIETGMKLKIGDIEYDIIVAGDIATNVNGEEDEKGAVTLIDGIIASCILNLNEGEILVEEDWDMNKKTLEKLFNVEINRLDMNLDGKVDEEDKKELEKELGDIDDIEIDTILDINEDGDFNEEDVRLIKYALDTNGDGTFDQEDMDEITENLQINFVKQETEKTTENNGDEEEPEETTENNEDEEELEETTGEDEE